MTESFEIRFGANMPVLAVEAVAGVDLTSIATTMSEPHKRWTVRAQKRGTFLTMTLPSGPRVTVAASELSDGKLTRQDLGLPAPPDRMGGIGLSRSRPFVPLLPSIDAAVEWSAAAELAASAPPKERLDATSELVELPRAPLEDPARDSRLPRVFALHGFHRLSVLHLLQEVLVMDGLNVSVSQSPNPGGPVHITDRRKPYSLAVHAREHRLEVRLPGSAAVRVGRVELPRGDSLLVRVEVVTDDPAADAVGGYLARSDLHAAKAMDGWTKWTNYSGYGSFALVVEGYRLLRVGRFDEMNELVDRLAKEFPNLSDSSVIRATQLLRRSCVSNEHLKEAAQLYLDVVEWPTFTEGARLLVGALIRLGDEGRDKLAKLEDDGGELLAASPFTAKTFRDRRAADVRFEVDFGSVL